MPDRTNTAPAENETRFGTRQGDKPGIFLIESPSGKVTVYAFQRTDKETAYLWVDTSNRLRIGTALPSAPNSDGTIVGTQS